MTIRPALPVDLPAIGAIYNHVVAHTFAIFRDEPITDADLQAWYDGRLRAGFAFLVGEVDGRVIGYATYGPFRGVSGYALTVENAVHLEDGWRGRGFGRSLMEALINAAGAQGLKNMIAAIDSENAESLRLHARLDFFEVGRLPQIACKFGEWRTLVLLQRRL